MKIINKAARLLGKSLKALWQLLKQIFTNPQAAVGFCILMIFVFFALFGRQLIPYDASTDWSNRFLPMSALHPLGTDEMGRDVLGQLVYGCRSMLSIAVLTAVFTCTIGVLLGLLGGYVGGILDKILQLITNLFLSVPSFPILLLFATLFTIEDDLSFALVLSFWSWAGLARAVRSQIISLKERDFIQICKVMNMSRRHIIFKELVPNISSYVIINFIMIMRSAITGSVGIMMLGLAAFDATNWGAMLNRARQSGLVNPEVMLFLLKPLTAVILFQIGSVLLANGLDEILNPRLREA